VFLGEPRKVQISKNIVQQYEALETILFQNASSLARPAGLRPKCRSERIKCCTRADP
jgi:hypothetical protein